MFGNKRNRIVNSVFGEMEYRNSMYHGTSQIKLWNKTFDIKVYPVTNSKSKEITPKQERAYEYFKKNIIDIQKKIEELLGKISETEDTNVLIYDNVTDDEYDADFVIIILPDLGIDTSEHYLSNAICDDYISD